MARREVQIEYRGHLQSLRGARPLLVDLLLYRALILVMPHLTTALASHSLRVRGNRLALTPAHGLFRSTATSVPHIFRISGVPGGVKIAKKEKSDLDNVMAHFTPKKRSPFVRNLGCKIVHILKDGY